MMYKICEICGREKSGQHSRFCVHKKEDIDKVRKLYDNEKLSAREMIAQGFNKTLVCFSLRGRRRSVSEANKLAHKKHPDVFKHTDEIKKVLSKKRKQWLNNNKDKHNWRFNFESYPEKLVREYLETLSVKVIAEYIPDDFDRFFKIDFAVIEKKIAIEVNGNQHYKRNGEFNEYHINRQKYLESKGWIVVNIPAINVNKDFENVKLQLQNVLNCPQSTSFEPIISQKQLKLENKYAKKRKREEEKKNNVQQKIDLVLKSNIDFSKFGWVGKIAKLLNKPQHKINKWMKKNMLNFYEQQCFKRKF